MDTSFTNTRNDIKSANIDQTDWAVLSTARRIRHLELEGYVVLPDVLSSEMIDLLRREVDALPLVSTDYSPQRKGCRNVLATDSPYIFGLVAHKPVTRFLNTLFGDELICTSLTGGRTEPGFTGVAIHTDAQPYGSGIFGMQASSPVLARVLYYLDDLTATRSPLKVVPRSHLSMHADANPYKRYLSHSDEVMVTCKAGSAAIINQEVFHGTFPNYSDAVRRMVAIAYRPVWAGPVADVPEWDADAVNRLPSDVRRYFGSLNQRHIDYDLPNRPDNMRREAPGIAPARWGD